MNKWWRYFLIFVFGVLIISCYWYFFKPSDDANNLISLIGTFLEIYGLTITFIELLEVKKTTVLLSTAVKNTKDKFQSILSLTDISRSTKKIDEILSYLGNDKLQMAYLRLKDLRKILVESEVSSLFNLLDDQQQIINCTARVHSDINDLRSHIYDNNYINKNIISKNLEELALAFTVLEHKIKINNV
jgi:hypothetical protein